jgi:DNA-binding transcriptional LysR family regulator
VGNREHVLERVLRHEADVAVSGKPPNDERLTSEPLSENAIACITAPDDPAAAGGALDATQLSGRAWLLREPGSGTRALNEQFLSDRGLTPAVLELGSNGAIKQAARAGLGVSLVSRAAVQAELAAGWISEIPLRDGPAARPWYVLRSTVGPSRPTVELFMAFVRRDTS